MVPIYSRWRACRDNRRPEKHHKVDVVICPVRETIVWFNLERNRIEDVFEFPEEGKLHSSGKDRILTRASQEQICQQTECPFTNSLSLLELDSNDLNRLPVKQYAKSARVTNPGHALRSRAHVYLPTQFPQ